MRDILFRGKRTDNGEWVRGSFVRMDWDCYIVTVSPESDPDFGAPIPVCIPVVPDTVGEYTGMFDRNGVQIFEGDLVIDRDSRLTTMKPLTVIWHKTYMRFCLLYGSALAPLDGDAQESYRVVGNIHDNPDLLEGHRE